MNNLYTAQFLHYYKNQPNKIKLKNPTHVGREVNISCGDEITFELVVNKNKVDEIGYHGEGCAVCEGSASILAEHLENKPLMLVKKLTTDKYLKLLGIELTPSRENCALLPYLALHQAVQ
jgi:nitrogen fixation protein NifU and related proteins